MDLNQVFTSIITSGQSGTFSFSLDSKPDDESWQKFKTDLSEELAIQGKKVSVQLNENNSVVVIVF